MRVINLLGKVSRDSTARRHEDEVPHFTEHDAYEAVEHMNNEDGSKGPHWTVEETTAIANQLGINLKSEKHNKWDWYVAMNMIYSDFYKAVVAITGSVNTKHFAELAKAWLCDKDVSEGKMWNYYIHIMCEEDDDEEYEMYRHRMGRSHYPEYGYHREYDYDPYYGDHNYRGRKHYMEVDYEHEDDDHEEEMKHRRARNTSVRYF